MKKKIHTLATSITLIAIGSLSYFAFDKIGADLLIACGLISASLLIATQEPDNDEGDDSGL